MSRIFVVVLRGVDFKRTYLIRADSAIDAITTVGKEWATIESDFDVQCFRADGMNFLVEK